MIAVYDDCKFLVTADAFSLNVNIYNLQSWSTSAIRHSSASVSTVNKQTKIMLFIARSFPKAPKLWI